METDTKAGGLGGGGAADLVLVVDMTSGGEKRPVYCIDNKELHFAKVYSLIEKPADALLASDIRVPSKGLTPYIAHAVFRHPNPQLSFEQFCEHENIPRDEPLVNDLLSMDQQPTGKTQIRLEVGMMVLAKASGPPYFYPAKITRITTSDDEKKRKEWLYQVCYVGKKSGHGNSQNYATLRKEGLKPLYEDFPLKVLQNGRQFNAVYPSKDRNVMHLPMPQLSSVTFANPKKEVNAAQPISADGSKDVPTQRARRDKNNPDRVKRAATSSQPETTTNIRPVKRRKDNRGMIAQGDVEPNNDANQSENVDISGPSRAPETTASSLEERISKYVDTETPRIVAKMEKYYQDLDKWAKVSPEERENLLLHEWELEYQYEALAYKVDSIDQIRFRCYWSRLAQAHNMKLLPEEADFAVEEHSEWLHNKVLPKDATEQEMREMDWPLCQVCGEPLASDEVGLRVCQVDVGACHFKSGGDLSQAAQDLQPDLATKISDDVQAEPSSDQTTHTRATNVTAASSKPVESARQKNRRKRREKAKR